MPQSLTQMPKEADFQIGKWPIEIRNHRVTGTGLFCRIMRLIDDHPSYGNTLYQFEKHGICYEVAIEECARELEGDTKIFEHFIVWQCDIADLDDQTVNFSESTAGRKIAEQYIEKIRSCDNWGELYEEMHHTSKFCQDMKGRIFKEVNEQRRTREEIKQ